MDNEARKKVIKDLLHSREWTQADLARALDLSEQYVSSLLSDSKYGRAISEKTANKIAQVLEVDPAVIMQGKRIATLQKTKIEEEYPFMAGIHEFVRYAAERNISAADAVDAIIQILQGYRVVCKK